MAVYTCGRCGVLCEKSDSRCSQCGRLAPALFGLRPLLDRLFPRNGRRTQHVAMFLVILYLLMTLVAQRRDDTQEGMLGRFTAGKMTMLQFGYLDPDVLRPIAYDKTYLSPNPLPEPFTIYHEWWRLLTANLIHIGLLHILFNSIAMFQAGGFVERLYGPARMLIVFIVAGVIGFAASLAIDPVPTAGASAGICGFIGAMFAYGRKRGGSHGEAVRNYAFQWSVMVIGFGLLVPSVNNVAHIGGGIGGFLAALPFSVVNLEQRGRESDGARIASLLVMIGALVAIGFAVKNGLHLQRLLDAAR